MHAVAAAIAQYFMYSSLIGAIGCARVSSPLFGFQRPVGQVLLRSSFFPALRSSGVTSSSDGTLVYCSSSLSYPRKALRPFSIAA